MVVRAPDVELAVVAALTALLVVGDV